MSELAMWWEEFGTNVDVETFTGDGVHGETFAAPQTVKMWVVGGTQLVRGPEGGQEVSTRTLYGPVSLAPLFKTRSRVTFPDDSTRAVAQVDVLDAPSEDLPVHLAVRVE